MIKIQTLSLAKECYSMKLELLTNATVVDDAIRSVSSKSKDKDKETTKSAIVKMTKKNQMSKVTVKIGWRKSIRSMYTNLRIQVQPTDNSGDYQGCHRAGCLQAL
jgi:hypothetical protein